MQIKNLNEQVLSKQWSTLKRVSFDYLRRDGSWQHLVREIHDHGNGVVILLYNLERQSVILISQFRYPVFASRGDGMIIEAPAGLLEGPSPEAQIRAEVEEETGYKINHVQKIYQAFMTPGAVTEELHFFIAQYEAGDKIHQGGGLKEEGEDIEVLEIPFSVAIEKLKNGDIIDAKTIILLQYAALNIFI